MLQFLREYMQSLEIFGGIMVFAAFDHEVEGPPLAAVFDTFPYLSGYYYLAMIYFDLILAQSTSLSSLSGRPSLNLRTFLNLMSFMQYTRRLVLELRTIKR